MVLVVECGDAKGLRRGRGGGSERVYNREAATDCGMRHAGVARVEASKLSCGGGGAVRAGRADRWEAWRRRRGSGGSVRCGWELSVLAYGLHERRDGLKVGQELCGATGGWMYGVVSRMAFVGMRDLGWCFVVVVCGDGSLWTWGCAGETNVWASDLDSGERLAACACAGCTHLPPLRAMAASLLVAECGDAKGLRRGLAEG
jgi:hypothetical protein